MPDPTANPEGDAVVPAAPAIDTLASAGTKKRASKAPSAAVFLAFLAAGIFLFIFCPPLWRDYDGLIQISNRPSDLTIIQYPPVYPTFSRLHVYFAQVLQDKVNGAKSDIQIRKTVQLNDPGIYALMVTQQTALALALMAFVLTSARGWPARWTIVALLVSNASFFVTANLISTEALSVSLTIALIAISLRIFLDGRVTIRSILLYAVCLLVTILTRHTNAIFAMLLPVACFLRWITSWVATRRASLEPWKQIAIFIVAGLISIELSKLTIQTLCKVYNVPYRSISARATVERLGFVNQMPETERAQFLNNLIQETSDPVVKEAIPALARSASWVEQRDAIKMIIRRRWPRIKDRELTLQAESCMDQVAGMYFHTCDRRLIADSVHSFWMAMKTSGSKVSEYYLDTAAYSIDLYASKPELSAKTWDLSVCSQECKEQIKKFESNPWIWLWKPFGFGLMLLAASAAALVCLFKKIGDPSAPIFVLSLGVTALTATALTFIMVEYIPRFAAIADIFSFLALALILAHIIDARRAKPNAPAGN